jgi:hypothetical protein
MKALQITTSGEIIELKDITLESLQGGVGGVIQAIALDGLTLWCNDNGKTEGLPHNPYAQELWDSVYGVKTDYLVGDVVITGGTDAKGDTIPLTRIEADILIDIAATVAEFVGPRITITTWGDQ